MNAEMKSSNKQSSHSEDYELRLCGRVTTPLILNIEQLRAMDPAETDDLPMICGNGDPKGCIGHCRGVLLSDIINRADILITGHNDTRKMFIVASSDDGYKVVFSWQEIFNTPTGEGIMVLLEKNGRSLYEEHGAVDLVSARDYLTGPRYVRQLRIIEIVLVE
ncbi:MAG: molybdopterin-dependent oxidoreductase [Proteobacteria bacterium]|nr:molybdopterin-dependent oxidoreductase [Pseudomonadota bacterium]MBU4295949.1 molybdopterin-dependent oxidoreductase [Pseudomonadota bacterium]MCG2746159.1 molybdopterin-dependent oxidoreductase [Desulfobulbaceae bacterium]